jgi:hypothetical protein
VRDTDIAITFFAILADAATLSITGAFAASRSGDGRTWAWLRGEPRASPGQGPSRLWRRLALGLSAGGAAIAAYHVLIERFPSIEAGTCDPAVPCSLVWFERLGFVTLTFMALSGFVLVGAVLLAAGVGSTVAHCPTPLAAPAPSGEAVTRADVPALQETAR